MFNGSLLIPALQLDSMPTCFSDGFPKISSSAQDLIKSPRSYQVPKISSSPQDLIMFPRSHHVSKISSCGGISQCPLFLVLSFSALPTQQPYASAIDLRLCATVDYEESEGHCCGRDCWCSWWKGSWSSKE